MIPVQSKRWVVWINLVSSIIFLVIQIPLVTFTPTDDVVVVDSKETFLESSVSRGLSATSARREKRQTKRERRSLSILEEDEADDGFSLFISNNKTNIISTVSTRRNITEDCRYWSDLFRNESMKNNLEEAQRRVRMFAETPCGHLWFATTPSKEEKHLPPKDSRIRVVVAYCARSLEWLEEALRAFSETHGYVISVQVYSKCGKEHEIKSSIQNISRFVTLITVHTIPNVGGCDHTYAQWLAHHDTNEDYDYVLFVKDTHTLGVVEQEPTQQEQHRSFVDMLASASTRGFGCGNNPPLPTKKLQLKGVDDTYGYATLSPYHATSILKGFRVKWHDYKRKTERMQLILDNDSQSSSLPFESNYTQLRYYMQDLLSTKSFPLDRRQSNSSSTLTQAQRSVVQVCYGGVFAVHRDAIRDRISDDVDIWKRLTHSLSRANNIEEGHFVERLWAALFVTSPQLTDEEAKAINLFADGSMTFQGTMFGTLAAFL